MKLRSIKSDNLISIKVELKSPSFSREGFRIGKIRQYLKFIIFIFLFQAISCTQDFENINTNPTTPVDVQPDHLLRKVLYDYAEQMSYEGFVAGNLLGQYFKL